jgi:hypothetical protein
MHSALNPASIVQPPKGILEIDGTRSPVRFALGSKPTFVFTARQIIDPQDLAVIHRFTVKKKTRELTTLRIGGLFGGGHRGEDKGSVLPFEASKYNESSFRITPTMPLPPGEYAISIGAARVFFCFGVD